MTTQTSPAPCPYCAQPVEGERETCASCGKTLPPLPHLAPPAPPKKAHRLIFPIFLFTFVVGAFVFAVLNLFLRIVTYNTPYSPWLLLVATTVMGIVVAGWWQTENRKR